MDKTGSPPTACDYAASRASDNAAEIKLLRYRIEELEEQMREVFDWSEKIADYINERLGD